MSEPEIISKSLIHPYRDQCRAGHDKTIDKDCDTPFRSSAHGPYNGGLVALPYAGNVPMIGNLPGDPAQEVTIGAKVKAVIERHDGDQPYALVQWQVAD